MKTLHRGDLFSWATFDPERNVDFNGYAWIRPTGNVLFDPVSVSDHDRKHLRDLGGARWIAITNSDHVRAAVELASVFDAQLAGPRGERECFPVACARWLEAGEELAPGLVTIELSGSKTPGELAFVLDETTLITGDLVRAHRAGSLMLLPDAKLHDPAVARASVRGLLQWQQVETVLVGDGWSAFHNGGELLKRLVASFPEGE